MKNVMLLLLLCLFSITILAQRQQSITLEKVLNKVQEANSNIKISGLEVDAAKADFQRSKAIFLPNVSVSHTGMTTTNPLMAFGAKLNQEILTQADFNPKLLNDPDNIDNFATIIAVQQPLINMDGFFKRKAAKAGFRARELQLQRTKEYMRFEAHNAYMKLQLAYKMVAVLTKAHETAKANEKLTKDYFDQGLIQKADWLMAQVRASQVNDQLLQAQSNVQNASDYLAFLMGEDQQLTYKPQQELIPEMDMDTAMTANLENRADVRAMQQAAHAFKAGYQAEKMSFLPRLNAFGSYELYDQELFRTNAKGYTLGASLSWDVFKGGQRFALAKKGKAQADKATLELEEYKEKSTMELQRTHRMLADAKSKLTSSKLALKQSEESLQIRTNRFKEGLEKTTDLLIAESQHAQQELLYHQTIYEYNYAKAYHTFLTQE